MLKLDDAFFEGMTEKMWFWRWKSSIWKGISQNGNISAGQNIINMTVEAPLISRMRFSKLKLPWILKQFYLKRKHLSIDVPSCNVKSLSVTRGSIRWGTRWTSVKIWKPLYLLAQKLSHQSSMVRLWEPTDTQTGPVLYPRPLTQEGNIRVQIMGMTREERHRFLSWQISVQNRKTL